MYQVASLSFAIGNKHGPARVTCILEALGDRVQDEESVVEVSDGAYSTSGFGVVTVGRRESQGPLMLAPEVSLEFGCFKCAGCMFLEQSDVGLALGQSHGMGF